MRPARVSGPPAHPGQHHYKRRRLRRKHRTGEWTEWYADYAVTVSDGASWKAWIWAAGDPGGPLSAYDLVWVGGGVTCWLGVNRLEGGTRARARTAAAQVAGLLRAAPGVLAVSITATADALHPYPARRI